jgi:serpin B
MRQHIALVLAGSVATVLVGCGEAFGPIERLPRELSVAEGKLIEADNRFAFKLFREINNREPAGSNVFISPLSVGMALGMTYNGAAGTTRDAMQQALELEGMTLQEVNEAYQSLITLLRDLDPYVEFVLANSIWYREGISIVPEFLDVNRQYFDAEVSALDFSDPSTVDVINAWVDAKTQGRIDEIVTPPIDPLTIMFLINAIYFKGDWTHQFDKDLTRDAPFRLPDGSETTVKLMSHEAEIPLRHFDSGELVIADLAYGGQAYSMTVVMPTDPTGIDALAESVTEEQWKAWVSALIADSLHIDLPKFRLEYEIGLKDVLTALGMGIAFSPFDADFTNLYSGPERAYISKVKHKTFVDVNEEGTEAAAVTSVEIGLTSVPLRIVIDRPFLFAIRENYSGTILFLGKVVNPGS